MKAGATDYLLKPYERQKMIEKVERYCKVRITGLMLVSSVTKCFALARALCHVTFHECPALQIPVPAPAAAAPTPAVPAAVPAAAAPSASGGTGAVEELCNKHVYEGFLN